jgi:hypothetical protein
MKIRATGAGALLSNTIGDRNTANGAFSLFSNTFGIQNTATGHQSRSSNTGSDNTAIGLEALLNNTTGNNNTAVGTSALESSTGSLNIALCVDAGFSVTAASNVICIGSSGADVSDSCFIGNIRGVTTAHANAIPVLIDSAGQLGTTSSSRRFKKEIKAMEKASESILALKPVTFHYNSDNTNTPQFGLIAEDVAEVNPDLVVRDADGKPFTVRYEAVNAMLLNEFLKEHRKNEEQQLIITKLQTAVAQQQQGLAASDAKQRQQIEALTARLEKQTAQIQKVNAQVQMTKPAMEVAAEEP